MLQALAPLARTLAPVAKDLAANVAQGAGQQLASNGLSTIKDVMSGGSERDSISFGNDPSEQKPAVY